MKAAKGNLFFGHRLARVATVSTFLMMTVLATNPASAATTVRSLVDRTDDVTGYQVHLVYVVPNGSSDVGVDINGQIDVWVKEGNAWLNGKVGHSLQFDTFQGTADVTFLASKYRVAELCYDTCDTLSKLKNEYVTANPTFDDSKTLLFMLNEKLDPTSCGWANYASNLALTHNFGDTTDGCNSPNTKAKTGLNGPAKSIIHELIHTFGIHHVCMDSSDLMIGTPECKIEDSTYGKIPLTVDSKRNQYLGSDSAFGTDLLKMPIWADGSGSNAYANIKQISDEEYVPQLKDDTVYAVIGQESKKFAWKWEKEFYPDGAGTKCQFTSGIISIIGKLSKSACVFDVPASLRAGKSFTVSQSWVEGPWHGVASVTGVLVRKDFSSNPCTENTCFTGGTTTADYSCWENNVKSITLQQLVNGKWVDFKTVGTKSGSKCLNNGKYMSYPEVTLNFQQIGLFVYRWFIPTRPGFNSYTGKPFAVVVNDENSAEPSQDEIASAQSTAIDLGKTADALKGTASVKSTITCIKGKLTKIVTGTNPKCPSGYKSK
jgi:hypothetical protein